ncbi:helix-turn-helix domain-containing protein [Anabaena azotica]|uniref:helix-turn-helix domain-containing protein n=1 Tax=Anabaena azotica TaxID=197653 RepID=UPI0039A455A2
MSQFTIEEMTQVKSLFPLAPGDTKIMTMASAYFFNIPGNSTVQISKDELRSLLREIESELHQSKVYRLAVANLQKLLGSTDEQAKTLFKAVGREAITLAFKQFAQKQQTETNINLKEDDTELPNPKLEQSSNPTPTFNTITSTPEPALIETKQSHLPPTSKTTLVANQTIKDEAKTTTPSNRLPKRHKLSKSQLAAQLAAEQRLERLRQIGEQLRQARESQGLTLQNLNIYTHISTHQMEAIENANFEILPEDILIRGFIRVMANSLGLNGTLLANSLPIANQTKSVLPSWYHAKNFSGRLEIEIRPIHLYVGYTALVAGALGGLSFLSNQTNKDTVQNSQLIVPTSSSLCHSTQKIEANIKPGIKSTSTGICVGADISPPEAL